MDFNEKSCESLLKKSDGKFRSAYLSFENDLYDSAVSDLYYSAFQSVCALMVLKGLSVKKHTHARAFLNRDIGLKGLMSLDLVEMYNTLMNSREDADYEPDIFHTREYAEELLEKVKRFNSEIRIIIKKEPR